jgi:hypothetical protein
MANTLDGFDLKATYGLVISNGTVQFLQFPTRKASVSHDWPEENGVDIDLDTPFFEAREFTLTCALIADNRDDFMNQYNGLFTQLSGLDTHALYMEETGQTYQVYYKSQANLTKLSKINNTTKVGVKFDLVFGETNPYDNFEPVYLIDENDNFIVG